MSALLFKDVTASTVHATTALGNQKKAKRATTMFAGIQKSVDVLKVDESLGLVFGWAIVCKKDGADYFDLQDDHIPEDAMLRATIDFVASGSIAKEMHTGDAAGAVLFAFPMTTDIAKAFGVETKTTGLMIAMKPDSADTLAKFKDGTYTGFSIGGQRVTDEDVS